MPTTERSKGTTESVRLSCEASVDDGVLTLRARVESVSNEIIHVFDDLGRSKNADLVCDAGGGAALIVVGVPPLPPFPCYWKYHPKTTALLPGEIAERAVALPLPLREMSAYFNGDYEPAESIVIREIVLRIDYLLESKVRPSDFPDPRGDIESVVCVCPLDEAIELARRADLFERIQQ